MQTRGTADATSWTYLAAMHGFDADLWQAFGYIKASTPMPAAAAQARDWRQCQHQSWYFLPWHRGYLGSFEAIVRAAVVILGGPADWALPYWNYNDADNPKAGTLPLALAAPTMPDGSPNPLFVTRRYGEGDGTISDAAVFRVYVGLPEGADPAQHPENLAGTVSLFGVRKATMVDGPHGGNGLNEVLEITSIVDALHLKQSLDADHLKVRFVPRSKIGPLHKISVGKVSLYRQGA